MLVHGTGTQFVEFAALGSAAYLAGSVFRDMVLIVLIMICLLACVFLLFVLYQWMRDAKPKTKTRPVVDNEVDETRETKHPHIVGTGRTVERRDRFKVRSHRVAAATERPRGRGPGYNECERMAYERIAKSFKSGKRS